MALSPTWAKSTHSTPNGGNCVQVRRTTNAVQVRDSKNPHGPVLTFTPAGWRAFTAAIKDGRRTT
ncbi:MAG TPA: DUF397 domain-containing protein [Streptosporangiaceae bacterium]|nr:DUF397 domain-containing protein [Streptosporangiaceae bacterium]